MKRLLILFSLVFFISCFFLFIIPINNPVETRGKGIELFEEDQFDEAIDKFDKCIKINPNDSLAYFWKGKAHLEKVQTFNKDNYLDCWFDLNQAIESFDKAISLVNDSVILYLYKGHALYIKSNKWNTYWISDGIGKKHHINKLLEYREECISSLSYFIDKKTDINYRPDSVEARHLLIQPTEDMNLDSAIAVVNDLKYMIEEGSDFNSLARNYSDDKGSAQYGGDLGWFSEGVMVSEFNDACFDARKGDLFIITTQFGVHLVEVTDISKSVQETITMKDDQDINIPTAYLLRGHVHYLLKRYGESLKDLNNCLIIDSENPNAWSQKGFTQYFGFNSKQEACECWKRAKNLGDQGAINAIDEYCNSFLNLKLIRRYNDYNRAHIILEFKNKSNKHIDKLWLKAELRDKEGSYLAGTEYIHFTNIGKNTSFTEDASWENINAYDIGEVVLSLNYLEIEGIDYSFKEKYFEIEDNKYKIRVHF